MVKTGFVVLLLLSLCFSSASQAGSKEELQKYFNAMSAKVKAADDPSEKRSIMNSTLSEIANALNVVKGTAGLTAEDRTGILRLEQTVGDKRDQLNGVNGFPRVRDTELNAFADYTVQDLEQAQEYVTISLVGLLLIVVIVLLLARG